MLLNHCRFTLYHQEQQKTLNKQQKVAEEEVHLESTADHHLCNADNAGKPETSTKQVSDVLHKPKQEAKGTLRKGPSKQSLPRTDCSIAPPQSRTAPTGKAAPRGREAKGMQQAIPAAKKSNKMAVSSKKSGINEINPLPSVANMEVVAVGHDLDSPTEDANVRGSDQGELYDGSTSLTDVIEEVVIQGPELEETSTSPTSEEQEDEVGGVDDYVMWERTHKELAQRAEEVVSRMLGQPDAAGLSGRGQTGLTGGGVRCEETIGLAQDRDQARKKGRKNTVTFQVDSPQNDTLGGRSKTQVASPEQLEGKVRAPQLFACMLG